MLELKVRYDPVFEITLQDKPPVEEPPHWPQKPPVEEPGNPSKPPPPPAEPPVKEPPNEPGEPPVKEPPSKTPTDDRPANRRSGIPDVQRLGGKKLKDNGTRKSGRQLQITLPGRPAVT